MVLRVFLGGFWARFREDFGAILGWVLEAVRCSKTEGRTEETHRNTKKHRTEKRIDTEKYTVCVVEAARAARGRTPHHTVRLVACFVKVLLP